MPLRIWIRVVGRGGGGTIGGMCGCDTICVDVTQEGIVMAGFALAWGFGGAGGWRQSDRNIRQIYSRCQRMG